MMLDVGLVEIFWFVRGIHLSQFKNYGNTKKNIGLNCSYCASHNGSCLALRLITKNG